MVHIKAAFKKSFNRGPKYEQIACATLRLQDVSDSVGTHDLVTLVANSSQTGKYHSVIFLIWCNASQDESNFSYTTRYLIITRLYLQMVLQNFRCGVVFVFALLPNRYA